ncbi:MAG: hypothetical protein KDI44_00210 [Thiothrix sp.]|nr:hypothetical protein [Thiothrix sp.]
MLYLMLPLSLWAVPLERAQVPEPLKPWVDWVLQDETTLDCPWQFDAEVRQCSWPSTLELHLNEKGGTFRQQWQVFGEVLVQLPGDSTHWPQNVRNDDNQALLVQARDGVPQVRLAAGPHVIQGEFSWDKLPRTLAVTPASGLVSLQVNSQPVAHPNFNAQGQLWLMAGDNTEVAQDDLDVQVFRKVLDSHPVEVLTSIRLRVSGKQRNAVLAPVLLDGMIPLRIESSLPTRLDGRQGLQVQLRPGEWTLEISGRAVGDQTRFALPASQEPWPTQEVWVLAADPQVRQVEVSGAPSIDPNQTLLPGDWKSLPAYLLSAGDSLSLNVVQRGAVPEGSNELNLVRNLWLDFDGGGYTLQDRLSGQLQQQSRLGVLPALKLGRVRIDGQPQFITEGGQDNSAGVEIRKARINLEAESRYEGSRSQPPVSGWQQDLKSVQTTLYLPPGWQLFAASGTDNVPASWLMAWSLLDLFLVLIIALAVGYLYGWPWGTFALLALALVWQEAGAPRFVWLNLLAVLALWRVLPAGHLKQWLGYYRWFSLLLIVLVLVPYMIQTVRVGLYPQLEQGGYSDFGGDAYQQASVPQTGIAPEVEMNMDRVQREGQAMDEYASGRQMPAPPPAPVMKPSASLSKKSYRQQVDLSAMDPNSVVQTGPGLPDWRGWRSVGLNWSGPVRPDETSRLWLIGPRLNLFIKLLGILLLLGLSWRLADLGGEASGAVKHGSGPLKWLPPLPDWKAWRKHLPVLGLLAVLPLLLPAIGRAATLPGPELLQELKQRLIRAPECQPDCAQIEQMQILVTDNRLNLMLRVHAATDTAIPLSGQQDTWMPQQVLMDGERVQALRRDERQTLWMQVPQGLHQVQLSGVLPARNSVPLLLPLKPHQVVWRSQDPNWTLEGVKDDGVPESQLQLNRVQSGTGQGLAEQQSILPVFVRIERRLNLGLEWYVETRITRLSPPDLPLTLNIPLLPGEQPMSEQQEVRNQHIRISLGAGQDEASWSSRLPLGEQLELKAVDSADFLERWSVAVSPVWHLEPEGIPVNRFVEEGSFTVPEWLPWPGETLVLNLSRPKGLPGQTVTIRSSQLEVSAGKRASDVKLTLAILSSRGVRHDIQLPVGARVQQLRVDDVQQQLQNTDNRITVSLKPGEQQVVLEWRDPEPAGFRYRFPAVDTGLPSVNARARIEPSQERWILWTGGPAMGPAVLFWGVLLVLAILAFLLGRSGLTPLKGWQWLLLAVGLSQTATPLMIVVAAWLMAISWREKQQLQLREWQFNLMQVLLAGLTLVALLILMGAVANGLLGRPEMQIAGNGSSTYALNWYQDRTGTVLPQPDLVSAPLWIYRVLMLAWALWLAFSVLGWLRHGWRAINAGGLWKSLPLRISRTAVPRQPVQPQNPPPAQPQAPVSPSGGQ